ncbi:glycerol-3-phosphate dehydrogenase [Sneathiella chinensis]|uniref:Glycerol-3-phosphate dehydrogenase n=1 Tax=Sneathiella chinensis TaxID=349750 RepID=A0ABQ5U313_9PROT|nr:glycerol-3-phosphate dehydrogenase [Sneathiella chinensis]GLQ06091.1 glycerol-3-phosphate dehydrogenase [Sneathiella chinensis]
MSADYDLFIIGGGINGCGIARDAVGRGYSVALCEMNDLASGTSSGSTKLVHGGLRYLEHYEFRLVREALGEREVLWHMAPHIIWPLRFVLPHHSGLRPAWLLRLGLFLYDHIGGRKELPGTRSVDLRSDEVGTPLKDDFKRGFEYSDCWVNDARLVALNAMDAAARGARIETRTKCVRAVRKDGLWHITTRNQLTGAEAETTARMLINASGPWVDAVLGDTVGETDPHNVRLVQGSHIVVPKIFDHDRCYIFQNADDRIIFAIPYEQDYTLIGTTDRDYKGDVNDIRISGEETTYLVKAASEYFNTPLREEDVVWTYSGVRPLYDDGATKAQEATRDYVLRQDGEPGEPPLINVFGGKITTYRRLAESMLEKVEAALGKKQAPWTEKSVLPGGDFGTQEFDAVVSALQKDYAFLPEGLAWRLIRSYGTLARDILGDARSLADLGQNFGVGLYEREVRYQMDQEWAVSAADVVWRRSKLGIRMSEDQIAALEDWMQGQRAAA